VGGVCDQCTWVGSDVVTVWAIQNGYPEVCDMPRASQFIKDKYSV